jgi:hypothetical protein
LLRITGVAAARRGQDEPILAKDREGSLHRHSRDLGPRMGPASTAWAVT